MSNSRKECPYYNGRNRITYARISPENSTRPAEFIDWIASGKTSVPEERAKNPAPMTRTVQCSFSEISRSRNQPGIASPIPNRKSVGEPVANERGRRPFAFSPAGSPRCHQTSRPYGTTTSSGSNPAAVMMTLSAAARSGMLQTCPASITCSGTFRAFESA